MACKYYVSGRVQGVGYRYFVQRVARELGLRGWARNLEDGRVEVYAVGTERQLENLAGELRVGPARAEVRGVEVENTLVGGRIEGFHIR
jgi:acylphosphatase